jgi:hydrogenase maturation protease
MNEWEWRALEERPALESLPHASGELKPGTRVRLRPRARGGDAMDVILAGKIAMIESIEQDYEGGVHLAVVVDDDPGRDLGLMRQPGHRFFYSPTEVEVYVNENVAAPITERPSSDCSLTEPILIAGIGNIFLADDGFGVAVAQRLLSCELPNGVRVVDYGIRGLDLAYALADAQGVAILVDACARGEAPGTLFVIEPAVGADTVDSPLAVDAHSMNPMRVIQMAKSMGNPDARILLVGCEPATLGPEEGQLGLSDRVAAAVDDAVALVLRLVRQIREGGWPGEGGSVPLERRRFNDGQP